MFTDRKKFHFNYPGAKVHQVAWVKVGSQRVAPKVNHAMVVNMYAGITPFGVTKPHLVAGTSKHKSIYFNKKGQPSKNITGQEYKDVVLMYLGHFCLRGKGSFQPEEYHPGLCSRTMIQHTRRQPWKLWVSGGRSTLAHMFICFLVTLPTAQISTLYIENVWSYVQQEADSMGCETFDEFQTQVLRIFQNLPSPMIEILYASMRKRVHACLELDGGKTKY
jgi:hypothetical protein